MRIFFILMALMIGLYSCKIDKVNDYEAEAFDEVFDDLIEQLSAILSYYNSRYPPPPPPPGYDTTEYKKLVEYVQEKAKIIREDTAVVIVVSDSLFALCDRDYLIERINKQQFIQHEYKDAFDAIFDSSIKSRPFDLSKIGKREKFTLRYSSEFPEGSKIWEREKYNFLLSGAFDISRIYFDPSQQFGLFYCLYVFGKKDYIAVIVGIHKKNEKWTIEEIETLWDENVYYTKVKLFFGFSRYSNLKGLKIKVYPLF